jgi:large subunit ribosomal protein L28
MTKTCIITGKKVISGFNVSHSKVRTKRKFCPNIHKRNLRNPATGRNVTAWISNRGLRTLKKWDREGKIYDLSELKKKYV